MNNNKMMKNSNRKRPTHTPKTEDGIVARDPHTLYNKISEKGILDGWFHYKEIIKTAHGDIYIEDICATA